MCADPRAKWRHAVRCTGPLVRPHQGGQALIEALVGLMALVPLVIATLWLGKTLSMRQAAIEASRLLAFECTVRPADCTDPAGQAQLADELRRRTFSRIDAPIRSHDTLGDQPSAGERNPLWVDAAGRPLLARFSDVGVRITTQSFDAGLAVATSRESALIGNALNLLSNLAGPARFGLGITDGLFVATVQVQSVPQDGFRMPLPGLQFQARTAILTDAWNATSPYGGEASSVQTRVDQGARIQSLYESSLDARYLPVRGFITLMDAIRLEPSGGDFRYHQSDVDTVPADRIGGQP